MSKPLKRGANYADLCAVPDNFVAEIIAGELYARKLAVYAAQGVGHVWLVNPLLETLEVLRLESRRWSLLATHEGKTKLRVEPFDAIELELGALWA